MAGAGILFLLSVACFLAPLFVSPFPIHPAVMWVLGALVLAATVWIVGTGMLRSMTSPLPPAPPDGEMRRVSVRYRCSICGVELRMTLAPEQDPPPPRHCMEDMDLVAPVE